MEQTADTGADNPPAVLPCACPTGLLAKSTGQVRVGGFTRQGHSWCEQSQNGLLYSSGHMILQEARSGKRMTEKRGQPAAEGLAGCPPWYLSQTGCCKPSACLSLCPTVAMPTLRLCLRMLYLISQVWNSNYVISQHRVAMTASPMSPGGSHLGGERRGPNDSPSKSLLSTPLRSGESGVA